MTQASGRYQLWPRLVFVVFASGLCFLAVQLADLQLLKSFAAEPPPNANGGTANYTRVAYVPVASDVGTATGGALIVGSSCNVAEVGDGGELGRRVAAKLQEYQPFVIASVKDDVAYVALGPVLRALGGELRWQEGQPSGGILLPTALITFQAGSSTVYRNYRPVQLDAPLLAEYGQIRVPLKTLGTLCGMTVETLDQRHQGLYRLSAGDQKLHVVVRERMYSLEACRSGRWLQVYFLGEPIKRYPICAGEGNNTPVGDFAIANKAVWPPWNAYWGEYMPGGSPRNPLGARWLGTTAHGRETGRVIGIHGTNQPSSIGQRISGGCMRCYNHHAIELFNNIPVGTPLNVHE